MLKDYSLVRQLLRMKGRIRIDDWEISDVQEKKAELWQSGYH
jgi:trans-2-enoyl-CoA reductase